MNLVTAAIVALLLAVTAPCGADRGEAALARRWPAALDESTRAALCHTIATKPVTKVLRSVLAALFGRTTANLQRLREERTHVTSGLPLAVAVSDSTGAGSLTANVRPLLEAVSRLGCGKRRGLPRVDFATTPATTPNRTACGVHTLQELLAAINNGGAEERSEAIKPTTTDTLGT